MKLFKKYFELGMIEELKGEVVINANQHKDDDHHRKSFIKPQVRQKILEIEFYDYP